MTKSYRVVLSDDERAALRTMIGSGIAPARKLTTARILLKADHGGAGPGWTDAAIASALDVNPSTVLRIRRQFVAEGLTATLDRKRPDPVYDRILDGPSEARLIATACGTPPEAAMNAAVAAWADRRNAAIRTIDWQFTTADACTKLRRLYPAFEA